MAVEGAVEGAVEQREGEVEVEVEEGALMRPMTRGCWSLLVVAAAAAAFSFFFRSFSSLASTGFFTNSTLLTSISTFSPSAI